MPADLASPPAADRWPGQRPTPLSQCLTLAALLHLLALLVLGNAPGGSARRGEGVWGAINVTLRGAERGGDGPEATVASDAYTGPQGQAEQRRWGGTVRQTPPDAAAPRQSGAARLGQWQAAQATPSGEATTAAAVPEVAPLPAPIPAPVTAPPAMAAEAQPALSTPDLAPAQPSAPPQAAPPAVATPAIAPLRNIPSADTAMRPLPLPELPPLPVPAPPLPPTPRALPPVSAPAPAPLPAPAAAPAPVPAPVPAPAVPMPAAVPAPAPVPTPASPQVPTPVPSVPKPVTAQAEPAPAAPVSTAATPAPAPAAASPPPQSAAGPPSTALPSPQAAPGASARPAGAPDAGSRLGHDVATPPSLPASAPRLNLELVRPRGGELSRSPSTGLVPLLPRPPEQKSKLASDLEKAARPDCRNAYAGQGLLAVVPLARDAVKGEGCRW